eukprot:g19602.t1
MAKQHAASARFFIPEQAIAGIKSRRSEWRGGFADPETYARRLEPWGVACTEMLVIGAKLQGKLQTDAFIHNAAIAELKSDWSLALDSFRQLPALLNAAISACEKGSCWKSALILLQTEVPDVISASGRAQRWKIAVKLLEEMSEKKSLPNAVSFGAASVACVSKQWRWSLFLAGCNYSGKRERSSEQTEIAWRSAKQVSRRPVFCSISSFDD